MPVGEDPYAPGLASRSTMDAGSRHHGRRGQEPRTCRTNPEVRLHSCDNLARVFGKGKAAGCCGVLVVLLVVPVVLWYGIAAPWLQVCSTRAADYPREVGYL